MLERLMSAITTGWQSGWEAWRQGPPVSSWDAQRALYTQRHLLTTGQLFADALRANPYKHDPRVYRNIGLLWNLTSRVVGFWGTIVYQGELSAEPGKGAIPIRPDPVLSDQQVANLMAAIAVLYDKWNWQRQMVMRPRLTASWGDCLTELIDDAERRFVFPRIVWPGYVTAIELDDADNVRAYTLEYRVAETDAATGRTEHYTYRKEVDGEAFRYFKDDRPFDYHGDGAVVPNVYGFVPAVWDRHIDDGLTSRGMAAMDISHQALMQLNSLISHARDFQHKAFFAPVVVTGRITKKGQATVDLSGPQGEPSALAARLDFLEGSDGAEIRQPVFDLGQTLAMFDRIRDGILANHPEAFVFDKLADAANVTGPGADRIILPVRGPVDTVRAGMDAGTQHLVQMAISMCGMRVNAGDWDYVPGPVAGTATRAPRSKAREAFRPFTLDSYANEEMGFQIITDRDIIRPGRAELIEMARQIEGLRTREGLLMAQVDPDAAAAMLAQQRETLMTGMGVGAFAQDFTEGQA